MVLSEVSNLNVVSHLEVSVERNLAHDALYECCFAFAVSSNESHFLASSDGEIDVLEDTMLSVALAHLITDDGEVAASHRASELEAQSRVVHFINLDGHNLLKLPYLLLNLNGFRGLIAETLYEGFCVCNLLLLILEGTKLLLATLGMERDIFVVLHLVVVDFAATDFDSTIRYIINKRAIMADEHNGICTCGKEVLEPLNALNVKVIRWLVEEKHIRMLKQ